MAAPGSTAGTSLPIACTLGASDAVSQGRRWHELAAQAPPAVIRTGHRLVVRYPGGDGVAERVRGLADVERGCCSFVRWTVSQEAASVVLTVRGPAAGLNAVSYLFPAARHS